MGGGWKGRFYCIAINNCEEICYVLCTMPSKCVILQTHFRENNFNDTSIKSFLDKGIPTKMDYKLDKPQAYAGHVMHTKYLLGC